MVLTEFEFVNGLTSLIIVIIFTITSISIILKYFKTKDRIYILVGLTWALMVEAWWSGSISFLIILLTGGPGFGFIWFAMIAICLYPLTIIIWLTAFTDFVIKEKQKLILLIFSIIGALFELFFFYFLFTNPAAVGELYGTIDADYSLFVSIYLGILIFTFLITGLIFAKLSLNSDSPEIRLRAKYLIVAVILFATGAFIDTLPTFSIPVLIIGRLLLILSAVMFYCSFILPNWSKKLFLKQT